MLPPPLATVLRPLPAQDTGWPVYVKPWPKTPPAGSELKSTGRLTTGGGASALSRGFYGFVSKLGDDGGLIFRKWISQTKRLAVCCY